MNSKQLVGMSKFISLVLRHDPGAIGLSLDRAGWADLDELVEKANASGQPLSRAVIGEIMELNDKRRFELSPDGLRIRALHGHSVREVDMAYEPAVPPATLYHGTATRFLDSIRTEGLHSGQRRLVHLSADRETAIEVGQRHGKPAVLVILAGQMHAAGFEFYQTASGVWLTEKAPVRYIEFPENRE